MTTAAPSQDTQPAKTRISQCSRALIRKSTTSLRSSLSTRPILILIISSSLMTTAAPSQDTQPGKDKDISVQPSADPKIGDITKEHPEHPADPHSDNFKFADNDDHPGKASHDDSKINDIAKEQPEYPAHPHSDNFKVADDDGSAHPGHATGKDKDISVQPSADPKIGDIAKEHPERPAHPHSDNFKFADNDDHAGKASHDDSKINDIAKEQPE